MHGRHRRLRRVGAAPLAAAAVVLALIGAAGVVKWSGAHQGTGACRSGATVTVAAAPEIAPVIATMSTHLAGNSDPATCARFVVTAVDPAEVAALLARSVGVSLTGLGMPNGTIQLPDIWIPDSSIWLSRLVARAPGVVPPAATSIAQSPLVLAMPQPVATSLGWPGTQLTWASVLPKLLSESGLHPGIVDPARDVTGLTGLLALRSAAGAGQNQEQTVIGGMRTLAIGHSTLRADLLSQFPRASDAKTIAHGLSVAPLTEQAVIGYDAAQPPVPLVALPFGGDAPALDYPYVLLPGAGNAAVAPSQTLKAALSGAEYRHRLAAVGLRAADGSAGSGFATPPGTPSASPTAPNPVDPRLIDQTLSMWTAVTQPARILTAIDVSSSMATRVPTAGNRTRAEVTVAAAAGGLQLFSDAWSVGLWIFSSNLGGGKPYRQLVPIAPLGTNRLAHLTALASIGPTSGGTGLYETILAAYQQVQQGWDPGRLNDVVIMTDGGNDSPGALPLDDLIGKLRAQADPKRPIQVIALGIGDNFGAEELRKIVAVTGGQVFSVADPAAIGEIFLEAISTRPY